VRANEFPEQCELVRVVSIEGSAIQSRGFGDVLNGYVVEALLFQQFTKGFVKKLAGPTNPRVEPIAFLFEHSFFCVRL